MMFRPSAQALRNLFLFWAGVAFGVSMLATPAKFLAPDLSLAHALQVGRVTFRVLAISEAVLLVAAFVLAALSANPSSRRFLWPVVLSAILVTQYLVMLPMIADQTDAVMAGLRDSSASSLHSVYVVVEVAKIALLVWLGLRAAANEQPG